ncbi:ComEA family DNA-binding protein [Terrimonas ferruginea]|uniref:ComEA family DNA-binding protein n=1 Tax=Terrimonas ferruginea TaxID=249 RepID=UPI0004190C5B|nr:helix-hairpin-helix domain-containing protein [Terrimonas ferruginea]
MKKRSPAAFLPGFTYKERVAVYSLLISMLLLLSSPSFLPPKDPPLRADTAWLAAVLLPDEPEAATPAEQWAPAPLFYFDPNTLDSAGWLKLGLREKTVRTLMRFRARGGRFRSPEDIDRIYGLSPADAARIRPYVSIAQAAPPSPLTGKKSYKPVQLSVDINAADSALFESLPGIGPRLAARIISFREKLGGFCRIEQIAETYGLPDSVFRRILPQLRIGELRLRQIAVNTALMEELARHPYIRYKLAKAIVAYRSQHGPFRQPGELRKMAVMDEETIAKLTPYLQLE